MKNVIVYGLGEIYNRNVEYLENHYRIVGISDKIEICDEKYVYPCEIINMNFDFIIVMSLKFYEEIKKELLEYGIPEEKIIKGGEYLADKDIEGVCVTRTQANTSASDNEYGYLEIVTKAIEDENTFSHFRKNVYYTRIVEGVSQELGKKCLDLIENRGLINLDSFEDLIRNDLVGKPTIYLYQFMGNDYYVSPTTLRYINIAEQIQLIFGDCINSIVEIGVGFGGQCRIIKQIINNDSYTLIDLPQVLSLAEKFLEAMGDTKKVFYYSGNDEIPLHQYDLVISNYAFSELTRDIQNKYLESVIYHSKHGFITWNDCSYKTLDGYSISELVRLIPGSKIIEENPISDPNNCVIIW